MKNVAEFMRELQENREIREQLKEKVAKAGFEDPAVFAEMGRERGYDFSEADVEAYVREMAAARREKTDTTADGIRELPEDMLEKSAGGGRHGGGDSKACYEYMKHNRACFTTFLDRENCWSHDACDHVDIKYDGYHCHHSEA